MRVDSRPGENDVREHRYFKTHNTLTFDANGGSPDKLKLKSCRI